LTVPGAGRGIEGSEGRTALITGISGQDGALLARMLLEKGYRVTGTTRNASTSSFWRLEELGISAHDRLNIVDLDVADAAACLETVRNVRPDEVYNLGGLSFIGQSFAQPLSTARVTGLGVWNLLDAIRCEQPGARFFQASSSEMFGDPEASPQDENMRFAPRSPYAAAKVFSHWATINYREAFGLFASSGILYNHESPLRGAEFVTRKISSAVARISRGRQDYLALGNLDVQRDWGFAPEYVEAMWRTLQADSPGTFVLATGRLATVRRFVEAAFMAADIALSWRGHGLDEVGVDSKSGRTLVKVSAEFFRLAEKRPLCGNPQRSSRVLGWAAEKQVEEICRIMVNADIGRLDRGQAQ
jgi:GDPmannose 4,6-dehydratase